MLNFVTWLWQDGWRPGVFDYRHVNRLKDLLGKFVKRPHRLICIADDPAGIDCETFPLWDFPEVELQNPRDQSVIPNCFRRLRIFDPNVARQIVGDEQLISMDLDVLIRDDITDLFDDLPDFKVGVGYTSHVNTSLFALRPGTHRHIWDTFDPVESPKIIANTMYRHRIGDRYSEDIISGSDQAWVCINTVDPPMWSEEDGLYQYRELGPRRRAPRDARIIFFAGNVKPWSGTARLINPLLYTKCP